MNRYQALIGEDEQICFAGIYDAFSASIASRYFDGLFVSGFGFAASHYGLPDVGFITWTDMVDFVRRLRTILPGKKLLVDIDDGYVDIEVAAHVTRLLESAGTAGVVLEDQKRPRKCGHFDGKTLMSIDDYTVKLRRVLDARSDMFIVARTDASEPADILLRARAYANAGADAILIDAVSDLDMIRTVRESVDKPIAFNQIAGGKSPSLSWTELKEAGVSLVIYSTPCLFAAQEAIGDAMESLLSRDGRLPDPGYSHVDVASCSDILEKNLTGVPHAYEPRGIDV